MVILWLKFGILTMGTPIKIRGVSHPLKGFYKIFAIAKQPFKVVLWRKFGMLKMGVPHEMRL